MTSATMMTLLFGISMVASLHTGIPEHINIVVRNGDNEYDVSANIQSKRLRGHNHVGINIDGDVQLKHLLGHDSNDHWPRRLGGLPSSKEINVPCQNVTSNCGIHGTCRISGPNKFCNCDSGYATLVLDKPCDAKAESQTLMAVLWYLFGWSGLSAFVMGWVGLGVGILCSFCCGCCCIAQGKREDGDSNTRGAQVCFGGICYIACFGLWIYGAVMLSTNNCVDKHGVKCKSW